MLSTSIPRATSVATSIWICLPLKISLHHHVALEINLRAMQQLYPSSTNFSATACVSLLVRQKITENISGLASAKRFKAS
jgi:hypothetical protein